MSALIADFYLSCRLSFIYMDPRSSSHLEVKIFLTGKWCGRILCSKHDFIMTKERCRADFVIKDCINKSQNIFYFSLTHHGIQVVKKGTKSNLNCLDIIRKNISAIQNIFFNTSPGCFFPSCYWMILALWALAKKHE